MGSRLRWAEHIERMSEERLTEIIGNRRGWQKEKRKPEINMEGQSYLERAEVNRREWLFIFEWLKIAMDLVERAEQTKRCAPNQ